MKKAIVKTNFYDRAMMKFLSMSLVSTFGFKIAVVSWRGIEHKGTGFLETMRSDASNFLLEGVHALILSKIITCSVNVIYILFY